MIGESKQALHYLYFIFSLLFLYYVADMKKLELCLLVVLIVRKIKFEQTELLRPKLVY